MSIYLSVCVCSDSIERLSDGGSRCSRLLPGLERDGVRDERGGRQPIDPPAGADDAEKRARHEEPQRDPLRPRKHQSLHAGQSLLEAG